MNIKKGKVNSSCLYFLTKYLTIQNVTSAMLKMLFPVNRPKIPPSNVFK